MTEIPAAGTAASGRRACACQYSAIWYGAYRGAADGGHGELHRERRQYPAGGTGGLRYGRAGRAFRPEYRRAYRHGGSRRACRAAQPREGFRAGAGRLHADPLCFKAAGRKARHGHLCAV